MSKVESFETEVNADKIDRLVVEAFGVPWPLSRQRLATTMNSPIVAICMVLLFPSVAQSQTLCHRGEIDYFSCPTTAKGKIVSICGNIADGSIDADSWLQYRFGRIGLVELAYPSDRKGSVSKFEGNNFSKYGVLDLRFIHGKMLYGVDLNGAYSGDDAIERPVPSGGVRVEVAKSTPISVECKRVDIGKYYTVFGDLNNSLREHNGETDFLYRFYHEVAK